MMEDINSPYYGESYYTNLALKLVLKSGDLGL